MTKPAFLLAVIALSLAPATATAAIPAGFAVDFRELQIQDSTGAFAQPTDSEALRYYLNMAHCVCGEQATPAGMETKIRYLVSTNVSTGTNLPAQLWVGEACSDDLRRPTTCRKIGDIADIDQLQIQPQRIEFNLADIMIGNNTAMGCTQLETNRSLWLLFSSTGATDTYDYTLEIAAGVTNSGANIYTDVTRIDTKAPPPPTNFVGDSAESAVRLSWDPPSTIVDIAYYQAFCAYPDNNPAFPSRRVEPRYRTAAQLCGVESDKDLTVSTPDLQSDGEILDIPLGIATMDPDYLCGEVSQGATSTILVDGLVNDEAYMVGLVAVDLYGNAVGFAFNRTVTPRPAYDFWEDLHNRGSKVEGGFCLAGTTTPGGTAGPLALVLGYLLLRRRRVRLPAALVRALPVALLLVGVGVASAQNTPYWEEQQEEDAQYADEDIVRWNVGLRLGPYTPSIDQQFGMDPGPYAEMFGGYQVLPMLDIDRIVWRGFGQLGFGGSIGYMQKSANAWATDVPGEDRPRSAGDENTFRLLPLAATVVYRFTWFDDNFGVPIVPYVRGGLSYYVWWMRTNGKTSQACWDGTNNMNCDADKALGGTIGVQGAIGIAIRAERVDSATATSMRAGGIQHAGFYGELSMAKVDGFGSDYKLSVGDATWFAGVNFEF